MLVVTVVARAILIGEQVEAKKLELVADQYLPGNERRSLISFNDYRWLDTLELNKEYKLTIEPN